MIIVDASQARPEVARLVEGMGRESAIAYLEGTAGALKAQIETAKALLAQVVSDLATLRRADAPTLPSAAPGN